MQPELSVVVCSNRPELASSALNRLANVRRPSDEVLLVIDRAPDAETAALVDLSTRLGVEVVQHPANLGLSVGRNTALARAACRHVVFVDDDVIIDADALDAIRDAFAAGYEIVGVRVCADPAGARLPWYVGSGQLHYLALHGQVVKTWGACMGIDAAFARRARVSFRTELGRRGGGLQSGDDTSFTADLRAAGGREAVLSDISVAHMIPVERLRLSYLTRRAVWQGRSEVRRQSAAAGLAKEWRRNWGSASGVVQRALALWFTGAVVTGILFESLWARSASTSATSAERGGAVGATSRETVDRHRRPARRDVLTVTKSVARGPRVLALDVGDVLYHDEPFEVAWLYELHRSIGMPEPVEAFLSACVGRDLTTADATALTLREIVGRDAQQVSDACWAVVRARWADFVVPIDEAVAAARRLAREHEVVIVANQPPECRGALATLGLLHEMSGVVLDSEVGVSKPDPALLLFALDAVGAEPGEVLVIGDRFDNDVAPALALGIDAVLVRPPSVVPEIVDVPPSFTNAYRAARRARTNPGCRVRQVSSLAQLADELLRARHSPSGPDAVR